jgi:hypothetical protein
MLPLGVDCPTVKGVDPLAEPRVAWIVACPGLTAVARPVPLTVATPVVVEVHVAVVLTFSVLPSE